jgi:hypothetical protein
VRLDTDPEILRLQAVLRDLVALSAIPAAWVGKEPPAVATELAGALVELLQLDFAFVRLSDPGGAGAVGVTRGSAWKSFPEWLERQAATSAQLPTKAVVAGVTDGSEPCRGIAIRIGVNGQGGVVAASERSYFPTAMEQLLLSLAANHAATAFENARLIQERRRAEEELREARDELEVKVAERTAELERSRAELAPRAPASSPPRTRRAAGSSGTCTMVFNNSSSPSHWSYGRLRPRCRRPTGSRMSWRVQRMV